MPIEGEILRAKLQEIAGLASRREREKAVYRLFPAEPAETQRQKLERFGREAAALREIGRLRATIGGSI